MKHIKLKIRPKFLPLIKSGSKRYEYRVASPKYLKINIGDVLILVSNQNPKEFVKVSVENIYKYKNWKEALQNNWENDFKGLFSSFNDVLKECNKYYIQQEIDEYGIKVFEIKPIEINFKQARYLFDTNIIIQRESMINCTSEVSLAFNSIDKIGGKKLYHPLTKKELEKYEKNDVKNNMLKKLKAYDELVPSSEIDDFFVSVCEKFQQDENSKIDNKILQQVYNGRTDFLITEDRAILHKAENLYIRDQVLTANEFLTKIEKINPELIKYDVLSVELVNIGTIDINDSFFDSLREDYGGSLFNKWFARKSEEKAYVFKNKEGLQGLLYLKTEDEKEDYSFFEPVLMPKKRLKIGTFKINSTGLRLGERFLKIIFDNALKMKVDEIYVTMFEGKRDEVNYLKKLMCEWGFIKKGFNKKSKEIYLVKEMRIYDETKTPKFNYPLIQTNCKKTFLPIVSDYHTKLFPDLHLKNENIKIFDSACSYAVEKIYVSGYKSIDFPSGTLMCVYRMADYNKRYKSVVTGICVLNEVVFYKSVDEFVNICKNKSVFSEEELRTFYNTKKYRTIIKVLFLNGFENKVNLDSLYKNSVLYEKGKGPRINTEISKEKYDILLTLGNGDGKL